MIKDWQNLKKIVGDKEITIEKVRIKDDDITIEGEFELPPLARLSEEDQIFVSAFVQFHGSIKQMEKVFGVSYPTIKNRLNRITEKLDLVKVDTTSPSSEVLDQLNRGELSVEDALNILKQRRK